ncbi:DnaA/Hda family protein [Caulobacter sp. 73W]|uniref:DnaA/Hda family protein n=1 Tax=Caulobacter sp. 73W TaxID=3161137 RepID=A0AB39KTE1_9CAUL
MKLCARSNSWPSWHGGCLALIGPAGVGKSHLAREWAARVDAVAPTRKEPADLASLPGRPVLLENADSWVTDEAMFHLINMAAQHGGSLLLTSRTPPMEWAARLPDLRSRLNAMPVAEIEEPDDIVLEGVLRKFFRERNIRPAEDVYPYLLRRMERSVPQALEIVKKLDEAADAEQKAISRVLARQILENDTENLELFE